MVQWREEVFLTNDAKWHIVCEIYELLQTHWQVSEAHTQL